METSIWDDATTGQKRSKTEIILSDIILLDNRPAPVAQATQPADEPELAADEPAPRPARTNHATPAPQGTPIPAVGANRPAKNRPPADVRTARPTAKERPYRPYRDGYTDPDDIAF